MPLCYSIHESMYSYSLILCSLLYILFCILTFIFNKFSQHVAYLLRKVMQVIEQRFANQSVNLRIVYSLAIFFFLEECCLLIIYSQY